jgi:hypothetical protein
MDDVNWDRSYSDRSKKEITMKTLNFLLLVAFYLWIVIGITQLFVGVVDLETIFYITAFGLLYLIHKEQGHDSDSGTRQSPQNS